MSERRRRGFTSYRQKYEIPDPNPLPTVPIIFRQQGCEKLRRKDKDTVSVHDVREWIKRIENTSIKVHTYQQV